MANWLNVALTIFYVLWLIGVLVLLWIIYRNGAKNAQKLTQALINAALQSANAAEKSADAALALALAKAHVKDSSAGYHTTTSLAVLVPEPEKPEIQEEEPPLP